MGRVRRWHVVWRGVAGWALLLVLAASVSAQDRGDPAKRESQRTYQLTIRSSPGLGGGSTGFGGRLGVGGEYWLSELAGVGLEGSVLGQGVLFGDSSSATTVALAGALRSAPRGNYFLFALGVGYALVGHRDDRDGLCLDWWGDGCPEPTVYHYGGYTISGALGWLAHPGASWFEIGPLMRLDLVADPRGEAPVDYLFTFNLALGYGLLK